MTTSRAVPNRRLVATVLVLVVVALVVAALLPGLAWAADPARDRQWPLDVVGAAQAHAAGRGGGATIAVVDSGVDLAHEDLVGNLVAGTDLVDGDDTPQDEFGHGTHVAGIAAAVGDNGRGIDSVAPAARIMPVRVLDADGTGNSRDVAEGVRWAVDHGADVVNLSLSETGQQVFGPSIADVVRYAWERGVIVVVAAGNDFVLSSGFEDEPALVVSATTRSDRKPSYSNGVGNARWGMAAPGGGCQLLTCPREDGVFSTYWEEDSSNVYAYRQGTSMAAPHVAGAAAVLRSLGLTPREVVDRLLATAEDLGASGRDSTYGAGRLDLAAAVAGLAPPTDDPADAGHEDREPAPSPATSPAPGAADPGGTTAGDTSSARSPGPAPSVAPSAQQDAVATPAPTASPSPPGATVPAPSPSATVLARPSGLRDGSVTVLAAVLLAATTAGVAGAAWARHRGRW